MNRADGDSGLDSRVKREEEKDESDSYEETGVNRALG